MSAGNSLHCVLNICREQVQSSHLLLCVRFMTASFMTASFSICIIVLLSSLAHSAQLFLSQIIQLGTSSLLSSSWFSNTNLKRMLFFKIMSNPFVIKHPYKLICIISSLFSNFFQNVSNSLVFCPLHPINIFLHHYISKLSLESFHVLFSECPTFIQSNTPIKFFDQLLFGCNYCTRMILFFLNFPFAKPILHLTSFSVFFCSELPK